YDPKSLRISWFHLDVTHIDILPEYIYNHEIGEQMYHHRSSQELDISVIENLLHSKFLNNLIDDLSHSRFIVTLKEDDERKNFLKTHGIKYKVLKEEQGIGDKETPHTRFVQGILDAKNQYLIQEKGLSPAEVALMADGYHTALADPGIYRIFDQDLIQKQLKPILYNALTGRSRNSDNFHVPWLLPGNMLRLLSDSEAEIDFKALFESFMSYLELSMLELKTKEY